ncbi:hypothetical protein JX266_010485 [Neoarthrinium moseri]|nr:hypothetical protein JX266_010485 [Neoarthrinium moseri]
MMSADERSPLLTSISPRKRQERKAPSSRKLCLLIASVVLLLFITVLILRHVRAKIPNFIAHEYGVGFHLTIPYGTVSISYPDVTIHNVAKIGGPPQYQEFMLRLSLESSEHLHPPYRSLDEAFPSTDVDILAGFIQTLRAAAETTLGNSPVSGAVVTVAHIPALYAEDLEDAFEYAGLIYLAHYPYWYGGVSHETSAAYAGNGFGLCSNYTDMEACDDEPGSQHENVLSAALTAGLLTSTWSNMGIYFAYPSTEHYPSVADPDLGLDHRHDGREDEYWALVRDALLKPLVQANQHIRVNTQKILLHGDGATDDRFREVVGEALHELAPYLNASDIFAEDVVYAVARGAAEMAKRVS